MSREKSLIKRSNIICLHKYKKYNSFLLKAKVASCLQEAGVLLSFHRYEPNLLFLCKQKDLEWFTTNKALKNFLWPNHPSYLFLSSGRLVVIIWRNLHELNLFLSKENVLLQNSLVCFIINGVMINHIQYGLELFINNIIEYSTTHTKNIILNILEDNIKAFLDILNKWPIMLSLLFMIQLSKHYK